MKAVPGLFLSCPAHAALPVGFTLLLGWVPTEAGNATACLLAVLI